ASSSSSSSIRSRTLTKSQKCHKDTTACATRQEQGRENCSDLPDDSSGDLVPVGFPLTSCTSTATSLQLASLPNVASPSPSPTPSLTASGSDASPAHSAPPSPRSSPERQSSPARSSKAPRGRVVALSDHQDVDVGEDEEVVSTSSSATATCRIP
ncbi:unnamed protein product, partial [Amoebophrya sp. A25]